MKQEPKTNTFRVPAGQSIQILDHCPGQIVITVEEVRKGSNGPGSSVLVVTTNSTAQVRKIQAEG